MLGPKRLRYNSELYERIRVLGKGSFGTAVVHRRLTDCSLVVLKEIDLSRFGDDHRRRAALQEARIMSELSHENIINYFNAYTTDTKLIIEMEYARIGTLQSYLAEQCQLLAEEEALNIFRQLVAGLDYLHAKQIVHLDLKMGNIFISAEGTIKLGDFGIAQFMATNDKRSNAALEAEALHANEPQQRVFSGSNSRQLGTLAYSSPERCLGLATDYQSDIWSLGCILYELLTLRLLFPSESLAQLVTSITQVDYQPVELFNAHISALTLQMFEQMIAKEPSERPSASELVQLVENSLARLETERIRQTSLSGKRARRQQARGADLSTEAASFARDQRLNILSQIKYPHSLVYQVRLDRQNVRLDRLNLPQSRRIKEIVKGDSHYLALTYDNIVYGWGSRHCGQLGSSNLIPASSQMSRRRELAAERKSRSARNSFTARDSTKTGQWSRPLTQVVSLTQPPSLASSTQTLEVPQSERRAAPLDHETGTNLHSSAPTSRPFIISELNKRKIERVAAGNNFSVFLSKTGIVMTCGDGSTGCLGRGELTSSLSPRMVDTLLSMDVVSVASGPEHVVAVCGNGQAFAWGNLQSGRLGLGDERALNERLMYSNLNVLKQGKYVTVPQLIKFASNLRPSRKATRSPGEISIVAAFCGDKSTVFMDSNYACWACGENRHNKLGLDIRSKFKRTTVINYAWTPTRIAALAKYKILSCSIGPNHSSFLTSEGKVLVLGQDIDHAYRLRCDMMHNRESQQRILAELEETSQKESQQTSCFKRRRKLQVHPESAIDRELLAQSLLANDQLLQFKSAQADWKSDYAPEKRYPKLKTSRFQRQQIETYLKRSRDFRRIPFEGALAVSCTSKFTLVLTADNRVYFWGTRSYERDNCCPTASRYREPRADGACLQIVPSEKDECFVKISRTNSSLMDNIELLGSDQPILHARDPLLTARSLADLWILDYRPSGSGGPIWSGSRHSSARSSSTCAGSSSALERERPLHECQKHDAILEPQPIVSLYVPSMFNYNGCALRLVNLFCHDEDRFFLVLDTTITMQQQPLHPTLHQSSPPSPTLAHRSSNSRRGSHQSSKLHLSAQSKRASCNANGASHEAQQAAMTRLNMVEESLSRSKSEGHSADRWQAGGRASCNPSLMSNSQVAGDESVTRLIMNGPDHDPKRPETSDRMAPDCCRPENASPGSSAQTDSFVAEHTTTTTEANSNSVALPALQMSPISQNGLSLEEPRSMSTFLAILDPNHNNFILGPSHNSFGSPLRKLNFEQQNQHRQQQDTSFETLKALGRNQRRHRSMVNLSESNGPTSDDFDETTSMPTWVKNEFLQQQSPSVAFEQPCDREQAQSSTATEAQSCSESDLTSSSSSTHFRSALSINSRRRPTDDERSSSSSVSCITSASEYQSTLVGSRVAVDGLAGREPLEIVRSEDQREGPPSAMSLTRASGSCRTQNGRIRASRFNSSSASQPDLSVAQEGREMLDQTATKRQLICDNIINCSVYKAASNSLRSGHRASLRSMRVRKDPDKQKQGVQDAVAMQRTLIERSRSKSSQLNVVPMSLASSNSNTIRESGQQYGHLLVSPSAGVQLRATANKLKAGESNSSSWVEMRETSGEVTMIEMREGRPTLQQVLAARSVSNQRTEFVNESRAEHTKTTSRWRQALNRGLSQSQNFSFAEEKRSHSLSSIRKSLTRIFC